MEISRRFFRNIRVRVFAKITIGLTGLIGLSLMASIFYQQSAMGRDRATFVSSNDLVWVDGAEMYIRCEGEGSPTVVFESGAGAPSLNWWEVQQAIAQDVRTCVYDRHGLGWSAFTGITPTSESVAQTLRTLLENAGESGPYVLVGHSLGGVYALEYAMRYPQDVVGMVLVDAAHQQQQGRLPQAFAGQSTAEPPALRLCRILAPTGILRLLNLGTRITPYAESNPIYHEDLALFYQSRHCAGISVDLAGVFTLDSSTAPDSLGDMPLSVLTAGVPVAERSDIDPAAFSVETLREVERVRLDLQAELAALSTNSSWTIVDGAAHFIHHDQPHMVIEAIRDILAQVTLN